MSQEIERRKKLNNIRNRYPRARTNESEAIYKPHPSFYYQGKEEDKNEPARRPESPQIISSLPTNYQKELDEARRVDNTDVASSAGEAARSLGRVTKGPKYKAPLEAVKLARSFRKKVKEHNNSPYLIVLLVAIATDFADATWIIGLFCKPFLFYFLWGKGTMKVKITLRALLFLDCIPGISWLPMSTIAVLYAWRRSSKEADHAKKKLRQLAEKYK